MSIYRHHDGSIYKLICNANDKNTGKRVCVYQSIDNFEVWVRPIEEFAAEFELVDLLSVRAIT